MLRGFALVPAWTISRMCLQLLAGPRTGTIRQWSSIVDIQLVRQTPRIRSLVGSLAVAGAPERYQVPVKYQIKAATC